MNLFVLPLIDLPPTQTFFGGEERLRDEPKEKESLRRRLLIDWKLE